MTRVGAPRALPTNANTSVGLLLVLLIAALALYRAGTVAPAPSSRQEPPQRWRVGLGGDAGDAACFGPYTFILTKDRLGSPALMILDEQGRLVRLEPLGSPGRFELISSPLGVLCLARDQGALALYAADGKRRWTIHLPGPITALAADDSGVSAAFGPSPGAAAGDGFVTVTPDGKVGKAVILSYAAITALARGPAHATLAAVFTADPAQVPEALLFLQSDGRVFTVPGRGTGSARLAAGAEAFFVGTARELIAYDSCGRRRWTIRRASIKCLAAGSGEVVVGDDHGITAYSAEDGKRLWHRATGRPVTALVSAADGIVAAVGSGLEAFARTGEPRWALAQVGNLWDLNGDTLVVIEKETAVAYRTH